MGLQPSGPLAENRGLMTMPIPRADRSDLGESKKFRIPRGL
jgi:hypothetical protein